eukprot:808071-Amphidinium_carterae.1
MGWVDSEGLKADMADTTSATFNEVNAIPAVTLIDVARSAEARVVTAATHFNLVPASEYRKAVTGLGGGFGGAAVPPTASPGGVNPTLGFMPGAYGVPN